jgi:hypothetical protein
MMDRLLAEDVIEFANAETGRYRQLATVAKRKKLFPDDMELVISTSWSAQCAIKLLRRPEWQLVVLDPIDVPATIRAPHAVVTRLKEQRIDRLGMDAHRWNWTLRVIQGLALEIERRGYVVKAPPAPKPDRYGYVSREQHLTGHLSVSIGDHDFQLYLGQARGERPHLLTESELRRKAEGYLVSTTESFKTDFITIRLTGLEPRSGKLVGCAVVCLIAPLACGLLGDRVGEAVGVGTGFDDGAVEGQPVNDRRAQARISKGLGPA